jgi:hypothetical protein
MSNLTNAVVSKYSYRLSTEVNYETYKNLKIIALSSDTRVSDLIRNILNWYLNETEYGVSLDVLTKRVSARIARSCKFEKEE